MSLELTGILSGLQTCTLHALHWMARLLTVNCQDLPTATLGEQVPMLSALDGPPRDGQLPNAPSGKAVLGAFGKATLGAWIGVGLADFSQVWSSAARFSEVLQHEPESRTAPKRT